MPFCCLPSLLPALCGHQQKFTISGIVKSKNTGESIIGASVRLLNQSSGTVSNEYGFYSLTLPAGNYQIEVSTIGKEADTVSLSLSKNIKLTIYLNDAINNLGNVVVTTTGSKGRTIGGTQTGVEKLSTNEIKNIPVIFGEKDVLKTIQTFARH